jgi:hypothetical protein
VSVNGRKDRVKTGGRGQRREHAGAMSLLSSLLVVAVVFIALYVLAALIFPERF